MVSSRPLGVLCVVGARPNFMKIAPLMRVFQAHRDRFQATLLHTGQHYDEAMKDAIFRQLNIPEPDIDLEVGSGTHTQQTAQVMLRFEPVLDELKPEVVVVVGDVNSTIACALVAVKQQVPVVHVEAGLRSFDRAMPEEINRVLTDQISDLLFTTEPEGQANLIREGIAEEKIHFVGNVMIDTLLANRERAVPAGQTLAELETGIAADDAYAVVTLHRPSNVDDPSLLSRLIRTLVDVSSKIPLIFPMHPRTGQRIREAGLDSLLARGLITVAPPLGYLQLLGLMAEARLVLSDSGGIQEETTALGVPCITLRENTERPITVTAGTNTIVGTSEQAIHACVDEVLATGGKSGRIPALWDGFAAQRIADHLYAHFGDETGA